MYPTQARPIVLAIVAVLGLGPIVASRFATAVAQDTLTTGAQSRTPGSNSRNATPAGEPEDNLNDVNQADSRVSVAPFLLAYRVAALRDTRSNALITRQDIQQARNERARRLQGDTRQIDQARRDADQRSANARSAGTPVTAVAIAPRLLIARGVNLPGLDLPATSRASSDDAGAACALACRADIRCRAFSWVRPGVSASTAQCWLKSGLPSARTDPNVTSGFFDHR